MLIISVISLILAVINAAISLPRDGGWWSAKIINPSTEDSYLQRAGGTAAFASVCAVWLVISLQQHSLFARMELTQDRALLYEDMAREWDLFNVRGASLPALLPSTFTDMLGVPDIPEELEFTNETNVTNTTATAFVTTLDVSALTTTTTTDAIGLCRSMNELGTILQTLLSDQGVQTKNVSIAPVEVDLLFAAQGCRSVPGICLRMDITKVHIEHKLSSTSSIAVDKGSNSSIGNNVTTAILLSQNVTTAIWSHNVTTGISSQNVTTDISSQNVTTGIFSQNFTTGISSENISGISSENISAGISLSQGSLGYIGTATLVMAGNASGVQKVEFSFSTACAVSSADSYAVTLGPDQTTQPWDAEEIPELSLCHTSVAVGEGEVNYDKEVVSERAQALVQSVVGLLIVVLLVQLTKEIVVCIARNKIKQLKAESETHEQQLEVSPVQKFIHFHKMMDRRQQELLRQMLQRLQLITTEMQMRKAALKAARSVVAIERAERRLARTQKRLDALCDELTSIESRPLASISAATSILRLQLKAKAWHRRKLRPVLRMQALFRMRKIRAANSQRFWAKMYDPEHEAHYYYNRTTGAYSWLRPPGYEEDNEFQGRERDIKLLAVLKMQSIFRAHNGRARNADLLALLNKDKGGQKNKMWRVNKTRRGMENPHVFIHHKSTIINSQKPMLSNELKDPPKTSPAVKMKTMFMRRMRRYNNAKMLKREGYKQADIDKAFLMAGDLEGARTW